MIVKCSSVFTGFHGTSSARSNILGVQKTVEPLHFLTKGNTFLLCSKIRANLRCGMESVTKPASDTQKHGTAVFHLVCFLMGGEIYLACFMHELSGDNRKKFSALETKLTPLL